MQLAGNTFLVTGGASGLGEACVRRFAQAGANVVIADLQAEAGQCLAKELGSHARFAATDVTNEDSVFEAIQFALNTFGFLHGSIQCAGIIGVARVLGQKGPHSLAEFTKIIQVNLIGTFNVIRLAADAMTRHEPNTAGERGILINTASIAAFDGQIGQAAYAASKGGIVGMTLPIARELARQGIRVMTIAPGIFDTPLLASLSEAARASLGQQVPFPPRLGRPAEFAALAQHIVENELLNGEVVRLDGALRMAPK